MIPNYGAWGICPSFTYLRNGPNYVSDVLKWPYKEVLWAASDLCAIGSPCFRDIKVTDSILLSHVCSVIIAHHLSVNILYGSTLLILFDSGLERFNCFFDIWIFHSSYPDYFVFRFNLKFSCAAFRSHFMYVN
jgi:hypothetical protein